MPEDFDSGTAPMREVYRAGYNANNYGGFPDNPAVKTKKKTKGVDSARVKLAKAKAASAKSQANPKFLRAKSVKPLPGIGNFPPKLRG
tara:strand:- start:766 stop:1029 length:264 start_codon:yes stop_codon:yes gene_type:complete